MEAARALRPPHTTSDQKPSNNNSKRASSSEHKSVCSPERPRQPQRHNRRHSNTKTAPTTDSKHESPTSGRPTCRQEVLQRSTSDAETPHQQWTNPTPKHTLKQKRSKTSDTDSNLHNATRESESRTHTLNTRVLLLFIKWVLISTSILCVHTHHTALPYYSILPHTHRSPNYHSQMETPNKCPLSCRLPTHSQHSQCALLAHSPAHHTPMLAQIQHTNYHTKLPSRSKKPPHTEATVTLHGSSRLQAGYPVYLLKDLSLTYAKLSQSASIGRLHTTKILLPPQRRRHHPHTKNTRLAKHFAIISRQKPTSETHRNPMPNFLQTYLCHNKTTAPRHQQEDSHHTTQKLHSLHISLEPRSSPAGPPFKPT